MNEQELRDELLDNYRDAIKWIVQQLPYAQGTDIHIVALSILSGRGFYGETFTKERREAIARGQK